MLISALLFVLLTAAGLGIGIWRAGLLGSELRIAWETLLLVVVLGAGLYPADALRYQVIGAALAARVPWRTAIEAAIANAFFSWITPGASLGAPAAIATLGHRGVPWDAAALIAYSKSMTSAGLLLPAGLIALSLGARVSPGIGALLAAGLSLLLLSLVPLLLGGIFPQALSRLLGRLAQRTQRPLIHRILAGLDSGAQRLGALDPRLLPAILLTHALYLGLFIGVATVLVLALSEAPLREGFLGSVVYLAFTYAAPTPGGAGLAEATAADFFGSLMPASTALVVVILFRTITFYAQIAVGMGWLLSVGGLAELRRWLRQREQATPATARPLGTGSAPDPKHAGPGLG